MKYTISTSKLGILSPESKETLLSFLRSFKTKQNSIRMMTVPHYAYSQENVSLSEIDHYLEAADNVWAPCHSLAVQGTYPAATLHAGDIVFVFKQKTKFLNLGSSGTLFFDEKNHRLIHTQLTAKGALLIWEIQKN